MITKIFTFILCVSAFAKAYSQDSTQVKMTPPKIAVKLALGETVTLADRRIEFVTVLEDSRCPKDVTCVWAGQAKVVLAITSKDGQKNDVTVLFNPSLEQTQLIDQTPTGQIVVEGLNPYPESTMPPIADRAYYVTLRAIDVPKSKEE